MAYQPLKYKYLSKREILQTNVFEMLTPLKFSVIF